MKTKRSVAAIFACAMAISVVAASASAIDYGGSASGGTSGGSSVSNSTTSDSTSDSSTSDSSTGEGIAEEAAPIVETVVSSSAVTDAIASGSSVSISGDSVALGRAAVSAIANAEEPVTFVNEDTGIEISIDPASVTSVGSVNLGLDVKPADTGIVIQPFMSGEFGLTMDITIPAKAIPASVDINNAHLFYISDDGKIEDLGAIEPNEDGSVTVSISHASSYVISSATVEDVSAGAGVDGDGEII
ncbi:MAG: hypothetical protein MSJ26_04205 [Oscillospiraceae bacterium]|nr:hypothetical protein [Oscillospiraceae bacterium]